MDQALETIFKNLGSNGPTCVIETVNAQFVCIARETNDFSAVIDKADMVVADGISVVAASRILGKPLPERVAGIDLLAKICEKAVVTGHTVYLLGGEPGVAVKAASHLRDQYPGLVIAGVDSGYFPGPEEESVVIDRIQRAAPDFLFVGMGVPKQEYWIEQHAPGMAVKVMMGVGGSFDVLAGDIPRAPVWMQKAGLEWLYRLGREPRRLWRRYVLGNLQFIRIVALQWVAQRKLA
jgi:N-acetylglucosaminyldiphosphoundecaprenol N-acetyl-beta-D-mannosaminyltransferase